MIEISVLRRKNAEAAPCWQTFCYEPGGASETVATALQSLNDREELLDKEGRKAEPIIWEHSCLQKKCGACAMVINGRPALACDSFLSSLKSPIRVEPLRKFPVVADLLVDRSVMFRNLRKIQTWLDQEADPSEKKNEAAHEASRCIQCGCCLEVCPNFDTDGGFYGMSAMVPSARVRVQMGETEESRKEKALLYQKHIYEGCGKSLACQDICPAGIDIQGLMARSNAAAVWRSFKWNRKRK